MSELREDTGEQHTRRQLVNHLPELLDNLAGALESDQWSYRTAKNLQLARGHAQQRHAMGDYKLGHLIDEYAALRRVTVRVLQNEHACAKGVVEVLHGFFDAAISEATEAFDQLSTGAQNEAFAEQCNAARRDQRDIAAEAVAALVDSEQGRAAAEVERDNIRRQALEQEQATQMRSNIISMLGHDMRSPLNSASVNAQMIARSPGDIEGVVKRAQRVVAAVERIDSMIQNLLDADRLESGDPLALEIDQHDLAQMVRQTYDDLVLTHGTRFALESPAHLEGHWDLCALQRTLENLCVNAVKYGDPERDITIRLENRDNGVAMSVHNWGPPLTPECVASLFKPRFRRIEEVQKAKHGWGLGLALVRAMAIAHGGHAYVSSTAEKGTTFFVEFPRDSRNVRQPGNEALRHDAPTPLGDFK